MLELRKVSFQVDSEGAEKEIVREISLTVPERKLIVVTGPNGGGKSTLAKHFNAVLLPSGGKVWVTDASCPDKICEHYGKISGDGEVIVCLPNRLIIQVAE